MAEGDRSPLATNNSLLDISKFNFAKFKRGFICSAIAVAVFKLLGIDSFGKKLKFIYPGAFEPIIF